jgi:hypothetical protein
MTITSTGAGGTGIAMLTGLDQPEDWEGIPLVSLTKDTGTERPEALVPFGFSFLGREDGRALARAMRMSRNDTQFRGGVALLWGGSGKREGYYGALLGEHDLKQLAHGTLARTGLDGVTGADALVSALRGVVDCRGHVMLAEDLSSKLPAAATMILRGAR